MNGRLQALPGTLLALLLASCNGGSPTSTTASNAPQAASAAPHATATPCTTAQCLDNEAYAMEAPRLVPTSPEQKIVDSIAAQIQPVVQPMYGALFHYYVTKQKEPNAYEYYGPRVYLSQGMVDYVDFREELAGVMCHESSHVIHHDGLRSDKATAKFNAKTKHLVSKAERLTHNHLKHWIQDVAQLGDNLVQLGYTRAQEEDADKLGATICSQAHINPWGLVAMLTKISKNPEMHTRSWGVWLRSDHPSDKARIVTLRKWLKNPEFSQWTKDMALTPLQHPKL